MWALSTGLRHSPTLTNGSVQTVLMRVVPGPACRSEDRNATNASKHYGVTVDMIAKLSAGHALPREVVDDVAARTRGVPHLSRK